MNTSRWTNRTEIEESIVQRLIEWSAINSHSYNTSGLHTMADAIADYAKSKIAANIEKVDQGMQTVINNRGSIEQIPLGPMLIIDSRTNAKNVSDNKKRMVDAPSKKAKTIFLCIHFDTVFPLEHHFQKAEFHPENPDILTGPGVLDAKSGILILLEALARVEKKTEFTYRIVFNSDEEIGSPASGSKLESLCQGFDYGLLFEPSLADGSLVKARGGSGNFTIVVRGKSAHVGREFQLGRNAHHHLAKIIVEMTAWMNEDGIIINTGRIDGESPLNVVADLSLARINIRITSASQLDRIYKNLSAIERKYTEDGYIVEVHGKFHAPPKPILEGSSHLFATAGKAANSLGFELSWKDTGGVCDGNRLQAAGLPNIDTLGGEGSGAHTDHEFVYISSLFRRIELTEHIIEDLISQ